MYHVLGLILCSPGGRHFAMGYLGVLQEMTHLSLYVRLGLAAAH